MEQPLSLAVGRGKQIYQAGRTGHAWRVVSGTVRLNQIGDHVIHDEFASLAIAGDIIGAETMIFGRYTFTAVALGPTVLSPWPEGNAKPSGNTLLKLLATTERRAAELLAMRCGEAAERVMRLINLLQRNQNPKDAAPRVFIPGGRDMADITGLTVETVSRIVSRMRREGKLNPDDRKEFPLPGRYFQLTAEEP